MAIGQLFVTEFNTNVMDLVTTYISCLNYFMEIIFSNLTKTYPIATPEINIVDTINLQYISLNLTYMVKLWEIHLGTETAWLSLSLLKCWRQFHSSAIRLSYGLFPTLQSSCCHINWNRKAVTFLLKFCRPSNDSMTTSCFSGSNANSIVAAQMP